MQGSLWNLSRWDYADWNLNTLFQLWALKEMFIYINV